MGPLPFRKLHGCRNDYVVVAEEDVPANSDLGAMARAACDRRAGIGADGLLVVGHPADTDLSMRMWNPDGSEAEMCGNGLRCAVRFAWERRGRPPTGSGLARTAAGVLACTVHGAHGASWDVEIEVGTPRLEGPVTLDGPALHLQRVSIGNPHAVTFVGDVDAVPVAAWGPRVERDPAFPDRTNVEFVHVRSREALVQRTWERGAGETEACGTGAAAAWVAARTAGHVGDTGVVHLRGGDLRVTWAGSGPVRLRGPATLVAAGTWHVPEAVGGHDARV
ncbi:MAG: diaminopimelate epimerase [Planctomycetota bacterium]